MNPGRTAMSLAAALALWACAAPAAGEPVANTADGKLKTATFRVADLAAGRAMEGKMDFRLVCQGPGDLTVTLVRVVKPDYKD